MMDRSKAKMETVLGAKISKSDELEISGQREIPGSRSLYFLVVGGETARALFKKITTFSSPLHAKSGGVHEGGCIITTPTEDEFVAIRFRGDISGWQKDIELGVAGVGSELAKIEGNSLVTYDGRSFSLSECSIEFT